jgi:molecular chaperone DnaK
MKDAEAHAEEDRKRRDEAETRNTAESQQYATEKFLAENGDKLSEDTKSELSNDLAELKTALGGTDVEKIKSAQQKLSASSQKAGGSMYEEAAQAAQAAQGAGADAGPAPEQQPASEDETVVDAEVVDEGAEDEAEGKSA